MGRSSIVLSFRFATVLLALAAAWPAVCQANQDGMSDPGYEYPVYQRNAFEGPYGGWRGDGRRDHGRRVGQPDAQAVSGGWFQRPYPYHLDYYRMKYGGSYAPYFGNLYGPPVYATPPFYGNYGPYYGGTGYGGDGYQPGYNGGPVDCPCAAGPILGPAYEDASGASTGIETNREPVPSQ